MKLSYVIPVYNGEKYISECIDSLYRQGISDDNFEVICIDDCSTDGSAEQLRRYVDIYKNFKLIVHSENRRTGTTINEGIRAACGDYIWIIGQDDWIEDNVAVHLLNNCFSEDLDVLSFNYNRTDSSGIRLLSQAKVFSNSDSMRGIDFIHTYFGETFCIYLLGYEWRALFRRDYLLTNNILCPEGVVYEDSTILFRAILHAERVKSNENYIYNYRVNELSVTDAKNRYNGYLTYEFAFVAGNEILNLAYELKGRERLLLYEQSKKYFKSFVYKVIPMSRTEKKVFYPNVVKHKELVRTGIELLPFYYKYLIHPLWGMAITTFLFPAWVLKHTVIHHSYMNK